MVLPGRAWNGSNRAQMNSNVNTTQSQGGGNKKAGFAYQVGRTSAVSIAFESSDLINGRCATLKCMQFTTKPPASISRPIGSNRASNVYFNFV
jgi:hypothetical protein